MIHGECSLSVIRMACYSSVACSLPHRKSNKSVVVMSVSSRRRLFVRLHYISWKQIMDFDEICRCIFMKGDKVALVW